jgi:hypothetical protein
MKRQVTLTYAPILEPQDEIAMNRMLILCKNGARFSRQGLKNRNSPGVNGDKQDKNVRQNLFRLFVWVRNKFRTTGWSGGLKPDREGGTGAK